jgi:dipeptidase D
MNVRDLEPKAIWNHFEDLNAVPRPSKKEERVRQFIIDFGKKLNFEVLEDKIGNVIIKKPATAGMENRETVILQSHIDMVHQKNADTIFDFDSQGIVSFVDNDWVKAKGTTLGADNGMGVAAAMSLLSSTDVKHPRLEALFTIDEETGMTGAKQLDGSLLDGKILLNLDTEDDDEFSVGCAGGVDSNTSYEFSLDTITSDYQVLSIELKGLKGGHSGMDINSGRANANLLMNRLIQGMTEVSDVRIIELEGGSLRNAIPRESFGLIAVKSIDIEVVKNLFNGLFEEIKLEFSVIEPKMTSSIQSSSEDRTEMMSLNDQKKIIAVIYSTPNTVWKMSDKIEGLVETSSSLAKVIIKNGSFITQSLQRSMSETGKKDVATAIKLHYESMGASVVQDGDYPGWEPDPQSKILDVLKSNYISMFNEEPKVAACHAGLECGMLSKHLPDCDMISFGPTIRHPHSPDEKVNIQSVQKFWSFLTKVIEDIPARN